MGKGAECVANTKILIHISDRDKWSAVLGQVNQFLRQHRGNPLKITILADVFAGAVCIACSPVLRKQMAEFVESGHRICACEESLHSLNIKTDSLPDFIRPIPTALNEIIKLVAEGYQYIKM